MKNNLEIQENTNKKIDDQFNIKKEIYEWIKALLLSLIIFVILNTFIATTTVYSTSMLPTLIEGDRLILNKTNNVQRGDIVSFESDMKLTKRDLASLNTLQKLMIGKNTKKNLIKRVIGMPGDTLEIINGIVYINGKKIDEPYINSISGETMDIGTIPRHKYFMMGDNRAVSLDSRQIGFIDEEKIIGRAIFRFYPMKRLKLFN